MMRLARLAVAISAFLAPVAAAYGQGAILQGGPTAPGRAPMYVGSGSQAVVQDSGPASGGALGLGLAEQLLAVRGTGTAPYANAGSGPLKTNWCDYDAPITNATGYHYLCLSPNAQGGGLLAYGVGGVATALPLAFNINGTTYQFPFSINGIVGPGTTVIGHAALWANTVGTLLSDGGVPVSSPGSVTSGALATYGDTTGKVLSSLNFPGGTTNFLRADGTFAAPSNPGITVGTTTISGGSANCIVYDLAGVFSCITTGNNGVLVTSSGGAPSISTTLPSSLNIPSPTFTGTVAGAGTIPGSVLQTNGVTNSQLAQMINNTIKCNVSGGTANASDCTPTQVTAALNAFVGDSGSGGTKGEVPAPSAGDAASGKVLSAGGGWVVPATGNLKLVTPMDSPYNAACDGVTDDSTALANWIAAAANNAFVGWGVNGKTCLWNGLIPISSGTTLYLNQMTLKLKNSGNANSSFTCGPTTELGGPITGLTIRDGVIDGNRTNQTNALGGSLIQCVSVNNLYVENTYFQNSRGDGLFVGGTTNAGGQGKSHNVTLVNIHGINNYRNNVTIDGVDEFAIIGGYGDTATNTNNDGPQCGLDLEPDDANGTNTNGVVLGFSGSTNGNASFSGTGGSAVCVYGANANTSNLTIWGPKGNSNKNYVVDTFSSATPAQVRLFGAGGASNGAGIYHSANIVDWLPTTIVKGSASSCGTGFACIGVPN